MKTWQYILLFVIVIALLVVGRNYFSRPENHSSKNAEVAEYDSILANNEEVLFVVVVKKGENIFVFNEGKKQLVFKLNRAKAADSVGYNVYSNLLIEANSLAEKQK